MSELGRERTGRCFCGGIQIRAARLQRHAMHCHCENCRRLTGNFVSAVRVREDDLTIEAGDLLGEHDLGYAHYGFCRGCGSTLYFRAADRPDEPSLMVGILDDASGIEVHSVWFAHEARHPESLPTGVPHYSGNE